MLEKIVSNIRNKLPIQNPLHTFVHNNILLMFENKDFHEAVSEAGKLYRARPYWEIYKYIEKYHEKKITDSDIFRAIDHYLGHYRPLPIIDKIGLTPREFYYRMMFSELGFNDDELQPNISNTRLWESCLEKMENQHLVLSRTSVFWRARGYWEKYHNESYSNSVHPLVIRLISSYLDQGQSFWSNPFINKSFWDFFIFDINAIENFTDGWVRSLSKLVYKYKTNTPEEVIESILKEKNIPEEKWEDYLLEILFDLKGWAGMVNKLELEPWQATVKAPALKLIDYIAVLVLIEAAIDTYHSEVHSIDLSTIHGRTNLIELRSFQLTFALYQITTSFKLNERWMRDLSSEELLKIIDQIDESEHRDRIRLWHEAFEHHFHREAIMAITSHKEKFASSNIPYAQIYFCIDDREESMRRYIEEMDPDIETFGVVGFFGIDMQYASFKNKRLISQCPPVVIPSRVIREVAKNDSGNFNYWNIFQGFTDLSLYYHSRTLIRGFFSTLLLGMLSLFPMSVQVFFPHLSKNLRKRLFSFMRKEPDTDLNLERGDGNYGYSKVEMSKIVEAIVRMVGHRTQMSNLILVMGHASTSNNNPFKQAYGCGACGGNAGLPNTRAFVKMANDPAVREELLKVGLTIPESTRFVGAVHDTCTDEIHFVDEKFIPETHKEAFKKLKINLKKASKLNAFERCQRFSSFTDKTPDEAFKHVRNRATDMAQPRPEYGHSSNALAIVGRRDLTKGLFMNRRSFLLSYDWKTDPDGSVLRQVVLGGIPVAVNINMDYYFSAVDNDNFGCGSKLPLNLTSLIGVMTGPQSDLRIGLARQMVEIHEPIRNLTIIEAPLENVRSLFSGHPRLKNILYNHWMRLAVKDPETEKWWIFTQKDYEEINFEYKELSIFSRSHELVKNHVEDNFAEIKL
jgi:uncharacterized protein YbcC (UPF0753/DUF2309 family)